MPSIEIRPDAKFAFEEIISGVSKLDPESLENFVDQILALRAKRITKNLSKEETTLLKTINKGLSISRLKRLAILDTKRLEETLNQEELKELMRINDDLELLNVERVESLGKLANLRSIPVRELMKKLDIHPKPYA